MKTRPFALASLRPSCAGQRGARTRLLCGMLTAMLLLPGGAPRAETYTINFEDTEIIEIIRFVADVTSKTFLIDPRVKGKAQIISNQPVDEEQLYDLFLAILDAQGFTAVHMESGIVNIVPEQAARTEPGPVGKGATGRENFEIVTQVLPLRNIAASKLVSVIRPLLPQQSHLAAYPPTNSIIISDSAANIAKLMKVIGQLDISSKDQLDVVELQYADAEEIIRLIKALETKDSKEKGDILIITSDGRTNTILLRGPEQERQKALELIAQLDAPIGRVSNARVQYLKYAEADKLAPILNKVIENIQKQEGAGRSQQKARVEADDATNSLIITADNETMRALELIISRLDIRRAQVLVEAIVVEVRDDNDKDLGFEYLFADADHGLFSSGSGGAGSLRALTLAVGDSDGAQDLLENLAGRASAVEGQIAAIGDLNDSDHLFGAILTALNRNVAVNILSTPSLLTLDNTEASVVVGQNVPFLTGSYVGNSNNAVNPFQTISRRDVGVTLKVTPHINEGDTVLLELEQEVSSVTGSSGAADIITNQRKITTTVLAGDGDIVVLGGLITDSIEENKRKIPLLGDIPLLGFLFKSTSVDVDKTNLLIFIRPIIIRTPEKANKESRKRYLNIRSAQLQKRTQGVSFLEPEEVPVLPDWAENLQQTLQEEGLARDAEEGSEAQ